MAGKVHIGTSGWHYKHWQGLFYPEGTSPKEMLGYYAQHFTTVELNNTFYRLPTVKAFEAWNRDSPPKFFFAVKASRFITHMKKLKAPRTSSAKFLNAATLLRNKLGPILFQLPPHWKVNAQRLAKFLDALPKEHRYVFEFREASWYVEEVYELLREHKSALCIHDLGGIQTPREITANFTYLRFHGPGEAKYAGSYSSKFLKRWAKQIREWERDLSRVYVYFNNDAGGHAVMNALELKKLVRIR